MEWSLIIFVALAVICFERDLGVEPLFMLMITLPWAISILVKALIFKEVQEDERKS